MEKADEKRFKAALQRVAMNYRVQVSAPLYELYWLGLEDLSVEAVESACARAIRECEFIPPVAKLRELARRAPRPPALCPWSEETIAKERERIVSTWEGRRDETRRMIAALPKGPVRGVVSRLAQEMDEAIARRHNDPEGGS